MNNTIIYIDEAGTLPDPKDRVIIIAAVVPKNVAQIDSLFSSKVLAEPLKGKHTELKFYTAGDKTKIRFFERLLAADIDIFTLVVDKMGREITDTPENFAVLNGVLLAEVLQFYRGTKEMVFDKHFHRLQDREIFNVKIRFIIGDKQSILSHVDSKKTHAVNVADMVAGAMLAFETKKKSHFYEMIKKKIILEIRLNWPEVKKRMFTNKNLV